MMNVVTGMFLKVVLITTISQTEPEGIYISTLDIYLVIHFYRSDGKFVLDFGVRPVFDIGR